MGYNKSRGLHLKAKMTTQKFPIAEFLANAEAAAEGAMAEVEPQIRQIVKYVVENNGASLQDLAAMGHPYSVRHSGRGLPLTPVFRLHRQSGELADSIVFESPKASSRARLGGGRKMLLEVSVNSWKQKLLEEGNGRMVPRPWMMAIRRMAYRDTIHHMNNAIRKNLRVRFEWMPDDSRNPRTK